MFTIISSSKYILEDALETKQSANLVIKSIMECMKIS